jgi:hypothetical protein
MVNNTYAAHWGIDTLQNAKKYYVKALVPDEALAEPLNSFIDAQTTFAKNVVKSMDQFGNALSKSTSNWLKMKD